MMTEKEDLGLSLSLSFANSSRRDDDYCNRNHHSSVQLGPRPSLAYSAPASHFASLRKASGNECFPFSDPNFETCGAGDSRSFLRGIDVNRRPAKDEEEEPGVSSPNSTISCGSGKKSEREHIGGYDHEIERASSRGISDEEDGDTSRKKLRLSKDQSAVLEESFKEHTTLNPKQKLALAKRLGLRSRQVEVWFQNRRARTKLKQTEVDCEFLKRCCEQLTEENRRLQKEVQELRALKLSPQFYMPMAPPTTLTMCPSCERVTAPPSFASAPPTGSRPTAPTHHRPVPVIPWVAASVPIPPFEALPPRA